MEHVLPTDSMYFSNSRHPTKSSSRFCSRSIKYRKNGRLCSIQNPVAGAIARVISTAVKFTDAALGPESNISDIISTRCYIFARRSVPHIRHSNLFSDGALASLSASYVLFRLANFLEVAEEELNFCSSLWDPRCSG